MEVLGGIVYFIAFALIFWNFAPAIILDIIWYKRVKSGKSKKFGPLGIVSIIVNVLSVVGLPYTAYMVKGLIEFVG